MTPARQSPYRILPLSRDATLLMLVIELAVRRLTQRSVLAIFADSGDIA